MMTFSNGMAIDIKGNKAAPNSEICQSKFTGSSSQQWLILPADNIQKVLPPPNTVSQPAKQPEVKPNTQTKQEVKPLVVEKALETVPAVVEVKTGASYKIQPVVDEQKCLTVGNDKKLHLNTYKD